jgi:transcriptional regulator with XRE-family HTH domain
VRTISYTAQAEIPSFDIEMKKRSRDPRDAEIAKRVRALRLQRGMSQTALGNALGVTFQQVQKYEKSRNRISAGRLQKIAEIFDVPVAFFYTGVDGAHAGPNAEPVEVEFDFLQSRESVRLVRAYSRIKDGDVRLQLLKLAESLAGPERPLP